MDEWLQVIVKSYDVQIAGSPEVFGHELKFEGRPNGIRQRVAIPREPEGKRRKDNVNFSISGGLHHWPVYAQCSFKMTGVFLLLQKQLIRIFAVLGEVIVTNPYKAVVGPTFTPTVHDLKRFQSVVVSHYDHGMSSEKIGLTDVRIPYVISRL